MPVGSSVHCRAPCAVTPANGYAGAMSTPAWTKSTGAKAVDAIDGVAPSRLQLPAGPWATLLEGLCAQFPVITREQWLDRFARGRVLAADGRTITPGESYRVGEEILYFREVAAERAIPLQEAVLHLDEHLLVADKPHFLPVTPAGGFVAETLLARLIRRLGDSGIDGSALVPLHRIDRGTAGLVLFSVNPETRAAYQALFREQKIQKQYQALAPPLPALAFPLVRNTRLVAGEPFFRMREIAGTANSQTHVDVLSRAATTWRYALQPVTGRKHQLRVHMAALGAPILGDTYYPRLLPLADDDYMRPLQLLAKSLAFVDPITGETRRFKSRLGLTMP